MTATLDPIVQEILAPRAPYGAWGMRDGTTAAVPADFAPTALELALLLQVRDSPAYAVQMDEQTRPLYRRLEWIGALRVDTGPTLAWVPYHSFFAALVADGR